jgi:glutamate---cysteine ligase / carboxylate-amine ligase
VPAEPSITGKGRYRRMAEQFGLTASEQLTCGCHVHVEVASDDEGVPCSTASSPGSRRCWR